MFNTSNTFITKGLKPVILVKFNKTNLTFYKSQI